MNKSLSTASGPILFGAPIDMKAETATTVNVSSTSGIRIGSTRELVKGLNPRQLDGGFIPIEALDDIGAVVGQSGGARAYMKSAVVFSCVSRLVTAFLESQLKVYDIEGAWQQDEELQQFLYEPGAIDGIPATEFWIDAMVKYCVGGVDYLHIVRNQFGYPIGLRSYSRLDMEPIPGSGFSIAGYKYRMPNGVMVPVPPEDVIPIRWPAMHPTQRHRPFSPIEASVAEYGTDLEATRLVYAVLANDAITRTALILPPDQGADEKRDALIKKRWVETQGGDNRGEPAVLSGGVRIERIALNLQELAIDALRKVPEARICGVFGVPAILAGVNVGLERSTFANVAEARRFLAENQMTTIWRLWSGAIGMKLIPEFTKKSKKQLQLKYDLSMVASLQENEQTRFARYLGAWNAGLLTQNESRKQLGYTEVPGGDTFKSGATPTAAPAQPPTTQ